MLKEHSFQNTDLLTLNECIVEERGFCFILAVGTSRENIRRYYINIENNYLCVRISYF